MKYVIIDHDGLELPIIFSEVIQHSQFRDMKVISAGEVFLYGEDGPIPDACCAENAIRVDARGESYSLGRKSRPQDSEIIRREILRHYH